MIRKKSLISSLPLAGVMVMAVVFNVYCRNKDDPCVFRYVFDLTNTIPAGGIPDKAGKLPPAIVKGGASVSESGALKLDGKSGYVEIPRSENIHITNGATFSAVVKFYDDGEEGGKPESHDLLFYKGNEFLFGRNFKQLYFNFHDGKNWVAAVVAGKITRGAWMHIAAVVERMDDAAQGDVGYKTTLFINGEPETNFRIFRDIAPQAGTNLIDIGKGWGGPWFFNGEIAEVSMYNRPLTEQEISGIIASVLSPSIRAAYVLEEPLDAMPAAAFTGSRKDVGPVGGRLKNTKALQLKDTDLKWTMAAKGDFFLEYWLKPVGWDGLSAKEMELSRFKIGDVACRLYKAGGKSELILEAGGEKLQSYPVYNWTEQQWMGEDARWHYINIQREGAGMKLTVDGFNARQLAAAKAEGALSEFALSGAGGTAFSGLGIFSGVVSDDDLRPRYRDQYMGKITGIKKNTTTIPLVTTPPVMDGEIGPEEYAQMARMTFINNRGKDQGAFEGSGTTAYAGYDKANFYMAFKTPYKGKLKAKSWGEHDKPLWDEESYEIFLQSALEQAQYVQLIGNPYGDRTDLLSGDLNWDGQWQWVTKTGAEEWTAELLVPLAGADLPSPGAQAVWKMNIFNSQAGIAWNTSGAYADSGNFGNLRFDKNAPVIRPGRINIGKEKTSVLFELIGRGARRKLTVGLDIYVAGDVLPSVSAASEVALDKGARQEVLVEAHTSAMAQGTLVVYVKEGDTVLYYQSGLFPQAEPVKR